MKSLLIFLISSLAAVWVVFFLDHAIDLTAWWRIPAVVTAGLVCLYVGFYLEDKL